MKRELKGVMDTTEVNEWFMFEVMFVNITLQIHLIFCLHLIF